MNMIDKGFIAARVTLNTTSLTLDVLAAAIVREPTAARALEVSGILRNAGHSLSQAFDMLNAAEEMNTARFTSMQEQIRSLTHQLNQLTAR